MEEFTSSAILAYECGYNDCALRQELQNLEETLSGLKGFDSAACLECVVLVWVALALAPRSVQRWATAPAVSPAMHSMWGGFVGLIVHAYFERRMAWYPLDRLQLALNVQGRSEAQEIVAERARVVFTTLEMVHPQFPKD